MTCLSSVAAAAEADGGGLVFLLSVALAVLRPFLGSDDDALDFCFPFEVGPGLALLGGEPPSGSSAANLR